MRPIPFETVQSMKRSRHRVRILLLIASWGEAYLGELSRATGLPRTRVKWILHGRAPYYDPALSLVPLGLVRELHGRRGRAFAITPLGLRKARSIAAGRARRAARSGADSADSA